MLYYYKRPGDWLWRQLDIDSIAAAARGHRVGADWRYRVEGDSTSRTLAELLEMEQLAREAASHTPADPSFVAPDGIWGYITVALCIAALALLALIPAQSGHSSDKLILVAFALIWMSYEFSELARPMLGSAATRQTKGLTRRCSQPLAVATTTFDLWNTSRCLPRSPSPAVAELTLVRPLLL